MIPLYWRVTKNFGDYMNHWIWPKLLGEIVDIDDGLRLVGIGSLLKSDLNLVKGKKVIFGTGFGFGAPPAPDSMSDWIFYFVRGPLTAQRLGLDSSMSIVDGAWLISLLPEFAGIPEKSGVSFIPHFKTAESASWRQICLQAGFNYIDPTDDFEEIISKIASSELVITESLHGAIFSDYYRTPWIPLTISNNFWNFKWIDWCRSVNVPFRLAKLPPSDIQDFLYQRRLPSMKSADYEISEISSCEVEDMGQAVSESSRLHTYKNSLKNKVRRLRKGAYATLGTSRNLPFVKDWNSKYQDLLAQSLVRLAHEEPSLSEDTVRNEKIERLARVREKLVNDYESGVLLGGK